MAEVLVFPDVTATVVDYLDDNLTQPVRSEVPKPRPATFVTIRRVGGPRSSLTVDDATLVVESWAGNASAAHDLAQLARGWLHALEGSAHDGVRIYRVDEFSGPGELPDPISDQARYVQTFVVQTRGTAA